MGLIFSHIIFLLQVLIHTRHSMKKLYFLTSLLSFFAAGAQQFTLIKDINPGTATSNICYLTSVNNTLFFAANDGVHGMELWKSDGTAAGTTMVKDINAGSANSSIGYLADVKGTLFFVANNGSKGSELWKTNGTEAGTVMVKDIRPGVMGSSPSALENVNGVLFFAANNGVSGMELWKSDGTEAGTVLVKDINPNSASGYPEALTNVNGTLFFAADNGTDGIELWKTDGTEAGTSLVKDIWPGIADAYPYDLTAIGSTLFFAANDGENGTELWKSDGTDAGTIQVKDIWEGLNDSNPLYLVNTGGTLFFSADNGTAGIELWKSDGTAAGTVMVKDIWPGTESGAVGNFSKLINKLIFTGNDGVNGYKTWQSDGTQSGTKMGLSIAGDANMQELVETGLDIFASIDESGTGSELWGLSFSGVLPLVWLDFNAKLVNTDALLEWKTTDEFNTSDFIIERSLNGSTYLPVGRVSSNDQPGEHSYRFTDLRVTSLGKNIVYYRIKQTDIDNGFVYSAVVSVSFKNDETIRLYPNPAVSVIRLDGAQLLSGLLRYHVFDANGKLVMQDMEPGGQGSNMLSIDISRLSAGVYYLDLKGKVFNKRMQFVKH